MTDRAYQPWTPMELARLRLLMRQHGDLNRAAVSLKRTAKECDLALFALMGRTAEAAAPAANWQARPPEWSPFYSPGGDAA